MRKGVSNLKLMKGITLKCFLSVFIAISLLACSSNDHHSVRINVDITNDNSDSYLAEHKWQHGSENCKNNTEPAIEVFRYQASSYILRQNKCQHFEAPFIYLLMGKNKALLLDTGSVESAIEFPLFQKVSQLMKQYQAEADVAELELLVLHSHGHSDHYAGDSQFLNQANVSLIAPTEKALKKFFSANQSSKEEISIDLGKRKVTILPTPGHQEEAITLYDSQTQWLLTGDSFYPGLVYVKHWQDYRTSIHSLAKFSERNKVSTVLGAHIEMKSAAGKYYEVGSTFQPNEAPLSLNIELLQALDKQLAQYPEPTKLIFDNIIIMPMTALQQTLSNFGRFITQ